MAVIGATNQELLPIVQRRPLKKSNPYNDWLHLNCNSFFQ